MIELKETENDDFIADSGAVKKVKRVNFHFSRPHIFLDHDPKKFDQFSLFQQPQNVHLLNRSVFVRDKT